MRVNDLESGGLNQASQSYCRQQSGRSPLPSQKLNPYPSVGEAVDRMRLVRASTWAVYAYNGYIVTTLDKFARQAYHHGHGAAAV